MGANIDQIFPAVPRVKWCTILAANTAKDGTGVVGNAFTAGPNGARIDQILIRPLGSNAATVMRFFVNDGTGTAAINNTLVHEVTLPSTTLSEVTALTGIDVAIPADDGCYKVPIPQLAPGQKINVTLGTAVTAGFAVTVVGADF